MTVGMWIYIALVVYLLVMNVVAFVMFGRDKRKAQTDHFRTPEHTLMAVAWWGGAVGAWLGMRHFRHKTLHWRFRLGVPLAFVLWFVPFSSVTAVVAMQSGRVWFTPLMVIRGMEKGGASGHSGKGWDYRWVAYEDISPKLVRAVIASEDNLFVKHKGFSQRGIEQAWKERQTKGKVRHGGSTISQQTAKNVFTTGKRTYWRKARETWYTVLIETFWTKQRIMEVYLNVIEMGNGIYGAEAASQRYFGHSAKRLTQAESALLAACLPSPRKYSVTHPGPYMRKRQGQIEALMPKISAGDL